MHSHIKKFDQAIAMVVGKIPLYFTPVMKTISFFGLPIVIITFAVLLSVGSWIKGNTKIAFASALTLIALGGNTIVKLAVSRTRPDTMYVSNMKIQSYSFPSGHAFGAAVFYGLLAYLAYLYIPSPWNIVVSSVLVLLIFLIGIARVHLGAHFPSDVVIGWVLGIICLSLIVIFIKP